MKERVEILIDELRRMRREGVSRVVFSPESVAALRASASVKKNSAPKVFQETPAPKIIPVTVRETPSTEPEKAVLAPPVVRIPEGPASERLAALRAAWLADPVVASRLAPGAVATGFDGPADARLLFLMHAPGPDDGATGVALSGDEGRLYARILGAMGLSREKALTVPLLPYRPVSPGGSESRDPSPEEIAYFSEYLRALLAAVNPSVVVTFGGPASAALTGIAEPISKLRGRWVEAGGVAIMPTYHISYLVRNNSNRTKRILWEDMLEVMSRLGLPISEKQAGYFK